MSDAMLEALNSAAESVRTANHRATPPEYPSSLYHRVGALADLMRKLDGVTQHLIAQTRDLVEHPPAGFRSDDGHDPAGYAREALYHLERGFPDDAHECLSHLAVG